MSFGSLLQSFGNVGALRRTEIKIREEAGCQSLSVEVHADTCGRDPNVLKPLQWCSSGSSERFVFISSCKCLLTGRGCCTITIQRRAAETLCARGYVHQRRCRSPGCAKLTLFVCDTKKRHLRDDGCPCALLLSLTDAKCIKAGITVRAPLKPMWTRLIF